MAEVEELVLSWLQAAWPQAEWLKAVYIGLATFILEDPVTLFSGIMVGQGRLNWETAFVGLSVGIALGDWGLYELGVLARRGWRFLPFVKKFKFKTNVKIPYSLLFMARFLPGMRLPTYVLAGFQKVSLKHFCVYVIGASLLWTFLLLEFGQIVSSLFHHWWMWVLAVAMLVLLLKTEKLVSRSFKSYQSGQFSFFELWPPLLFYLPMGPVWIYMWIKYRSIGVITIVNPKIYCSGLIGESKTEINSLLPAQNSEFAKLKPVKQGDNILDIVANSNLTFPMIIKPDKGMRGSGVKLVNNVLEVENYLKPFKRNELFVLQEYVSFPEEAGLFYFKRPGDSQGTVQSVTLKEFPRLVGDGKSSFEELIRNDERAKFMASVYLARFSKEERLEVLDSGQCRQLVQAGNHCQGAIFRNGNDLITTELNQLVESLASQIPEFYFGRFDIRYKSWDELIEGQNFKVIEVNGAGAEMTHIWDPKMTLRQAYRDLVKQFDMLFEVGSLNKKRGFKSWWGIAILYEILKYKILARRYFKTSF